MIKEEINSYVEEIKNEINSDKFKKELKKAIKSRVCRNLGFDYNLYTEKVEVSSFYEIGKKLQEVSLPEKKFNELKDIVMSELENSIVFTKKDIAEFKRVYKNYLIECVEERLKDKAVSMSKEIANEII